MPKSGTYFVFNKDIIGKIEKIAEDRVKDAGDIQLEETKKSLTGPRSGKIGNLPGGGKYRMSSPGETPAERSGELKKSIRMRLNRSQAFIGTDLDYGLALEYGTSKIKPRPFMRISHERAKGRIKKRIGSKWF